MQTFRWQFFASGKNKLALSCYTVSRIVRVIRQPKGNMLLVGIGGSGRQSLTRLAAHICDYHTFQIEVSKHYRKQEFREGKFLGYVIYIFFISGDNVSVK